MSIPSINPKHYHYVVKKLRKVCDDYGLTECYLGDINSTLSACEQPETLRTFDWRGVQYSLPQTSQMALEECIMKNSNGYKGFYNISTSYRDEETLVPNRHKRIFPLYEVELKCDFEEMIQFQKALLLELGIKPFHGDDFPRIDYLDACQKYGVDEIGHEEEKKLCQDLNSPAVFLCKFPLSTSPFFNMKLDGNVALKVDVIIGHPFEGVPMEVIGSSERSCDVNHMRQQFYTISDGQYAQALFDAFGKERIEKELEEYLSNTFFTRSGMGIGLSRLVYACESLGLFKDL
jgi:aspartyl/asparaginyl-tRNA synthetase